MKARHRSLGRVDPDSYFWLWMFVVLSAVLIVVFYVVY